MTSFKIKPATTFEFKMFYIVRDVCVDIGFDWTPATPTSAYIAPPTPKVAAYIDLFHHQLPSIPMHLFTSLSYFVLPLLLLINGSLRESVGRADSA